MTLIALAGDCTTTTSLALAAAWPDADEVVLLEADPAGGSLAGWLDVPLTPSLSTLVAAAHGADASDPQRLAPLVRRMPSGVGFVPAPFRSREAARAVHEARRELFGSLASITDVLLVDCGRVQVGAEPADAVPGADMIVLCHRQDSSSAGAATARLERLREQLEMLTPRATSRVVVTVVGERPYAIDEIRASLDPELTWMSLPVDALSAAVLAGRVGVSGRRLARLPLSRSAGRLADVLRADLIPADRESVS